MTEKQMTWLQLEANLSPSRSKTLKKPDTVYCPVCDSPRNKGDHKKCSKITQLKAMKARGEI
jgi:hypothetical protein